MMAVVEPSTIGNTTFLDKELSHRWVINDANFFFENIVRSGLRSPTFSVSLPGEENYECVSKWSMYLSNTHNSNISISINQDIEDVHNSQYSVASPTTTASGSTQSLSPLDATHVHINNGGKKSLEDWKIWICECTFYILDSKTGEIKHTAKICTTACKPIIGQSELIQVPNFIVKDKWNQYLSNDTLTIQMVATIYSNDRFETTDITCTVPPDNIREQMKDLFMQKHFADITIQCGDEVFKAHKAILAAQSPVFKSMFQVDMKEKERGTVEISDIDPAVMSDVLIFLYTGEVPNMRTLAKELLKAANKYELSRLMMMCEIDLKIDINVSNVIDKLILADLHQAKNLKKACLKFIKQNAIKVHQTEGWKTLKNNSDKWSELLFDIMEYV